MEKNIKNDYIHYENILHDIRLPLTIMHTTMQLLVNMPLPNNAKEHIVVALHSCYRMLKLLNDSDYIAKIERGHLTPNLANKNIVSIIKILVENTHLLATKKNIKINLHKDTDKIIMAIDKFMLERILLNLLSNAIKFTPNGGNIDVTIKNHGDSISIIVKDDGPGVENKDIINNIFNRYTTSDNMQGTGIGLVIVDQLIKALGGTIAAKNLNGAIFTATLPIHIVDKDEKQLMIDDFYKDNIVQIELSEHL